MLAFFIGSLGMIGIPPAGGFISKWYLVVGSVDAGQMALLAVLLISALLNAAYFLPVTYSAFFEAEKTPTDPSLVAANDIREIPMVAVPLVITALLSLLLGIYPDYFLSLAAILVSEEFVTGGALP